MDRRRPRHRGGHLGRPAQRSNASSDGSAHAVSYATLLIQRWGNPDGETFGRYPFGVTVQQERTDRGVTLPAMLSAGWWRGTHRQAAGELFRARTTGVTFQRPGGTGCPTLTASPTAAPAPTVSTPSVGDEPAVCSVVVSGLLDHGLVEPDGVPRRCRPGELPLHLRRGVGRAHGPLRRTGRR